MQNLFVQLFAFRAKENFSAKENFLSEAFGYFLQAEPTVLAAFIRRTTGCCLDLKCEYQVLTRPVELSPYGQCFPDLRVDFYTAGGIQHTLLAEHKWDSSIRADQLEKYAEVLVRSELDGKKHLVTIVAQPKQKRAAEDAIQKLTQKLATEKPRRQFPCSTCHLLWEDILEVLRGLQDPQPLLTQFMQFMKSQNLDPGPPIETQTMQKFLASAGFRAQLTRYAEKLRAEYEWPMVPEAYQLKAKVKDCWGRIGLDFIRPQGNPNLAVGFLYDVTNHRVTFMAPGESVDLFLRLEADPTTNKNVDEALGVLRMRADLLCKLGARVLLRDEAGNANRYSLLIAQQSLASVIEGVSEERAQIQAVYERLASWTTCLFQNSSLEDVLSRLKPFSGLNVAAEL